jgi:glycosyltransferase involved in cell wall biosynthesis
MLDLAGRDTNRIAVEPNDAPVGEFVPISAAQGRNQNTDIARAAMIGNYPPRQCGIATFTRDFLVSLQGASPRTEWQVCAVTEDEAHHAYPPEVTHVLAQNDPHTYIALADTLNSSGAQVAFIQHEFGIFGGPAGDYLLLLMRRLKMPMVVTLHTVLERPDTDQRRVMEEIIRLSAAVIVMAEKGAEILHAVHKAGPTKVHVIPHGAPDRPLAPTEAFKSTLGFAGKKIIMTFGLLSTNKGLDTVVRALPEILKRHPDAVYVVAGATHPHVLARDGESYRQGLMALADSLNVSHALHFVNRYVDDAELTDLLQAADVYVTPYLSEAQITSGTLSYAIALGKPVVSTPYWHATEALADGVGVICPFNDAEAFGRELSDILGNDVRRQSLARRAWRSGTAARWPNVGASGIALAHAARGAHVASPEISLRTLARPRLDAVRRLSDDVGILQHSKHRIPDRAHGYCVDDTARALALTACLTRHEIEPALSSALACRFAAFVNHAWNGETGRFRNFMAWDRRWLDEGGCDDSNGRTFDALCLTAAHGATPHLQEWATDLARLAYQHSHDWRSLRARAHVMRGCIAAEGIVLEPREVLETLARSSAAIVDALEHNGPWFDENLSYENARLPEALILAGGRLDDDRLTAVGLDRLDWLMRKQAAPSGHFRPIATSSFAISDADDLVFDQQPLEAWASIDACAAAFRLTEDEPWLQRAISAFVWFAGENDLGLSLVTSADGGCYDGLTATGCNLNQGAESVLSYQMAAVTMRQLLKVG